MADCNSHVRSTAMAILWISLLLSPAVSPCPSVCECKWKGGKQTVECRNRGLITLPNNIDPETQVLDLSGSNLQTLPREAFMRANLLNLQKIYLGSCRIGQIDPSALRGLTNLIELDLGDNMLTDVPSEAFRDATSLRELRLNGNPIQKIEDRAFDLVPGLAKLDLSDCQIQTLAARAFQGLDQLSHLRLGGNQLTEVQPQVMATLTRLHGVELHGNPWLCDCRLRFVREWLHQHNIPSPVAATCASPSRVRGRAIIDLQIDDFACPPQVAPNGAFPRLVETTAGKNVTLSCRMTAVPEAEMTWLWRGRPLSNTTAAGLDGEASLGSLTENHGRIVTILEEGKYDKASYLILTPATEADSGQFVCVATNAAGLAHVNLTLRVDMQTPVTSGLAPAHIAGISVALLILLAAVVAIFLLVIVRNRRSASKSDEKDVTPVSAAHSAFSSDMKSPTVSALEYGHATFTSPSSPTVTTTVLNKPDLIHETRRNGVNGVNGVNDGEYYHQPYTTATLRSPRNATNDPISMLNGEYQSAQTDSFYPSALWDHVLHDQASAAETQPDAGVLPHVPLNGLDNYAVPVGVVGVGGIVQYPDSDAESVQSISMDSYSLPCRMPQQDPVYGTTAYTAPYPSDYGLPRTTPPNQVAAAPATLTSSYGSKTNTNNQWASSVVSTPASIESSPASCAKSPRFWHRPLMSGKRNFARESPDEGYQEECATDV